MPPCATKCFRASPLKNHCRRNRRRKKNSQRLRISPCSSSGCLLRRLAECGLPARGCALLRLSRKRRVRCRRMSFALQSAFGSPRSLGRNFVRVLCRLRILCRFLSRRRRSPRWQFHSRAPRLRKPNGNCLPSRSCSMFALPDMIHLFFHELSRLRRRRLPFARILSGPLHGLPLRHGILSSFRLELLLSLLEKKRCANRRIAVLRRQRLLYLVLVQRSPVSSAACAV